MSTPYPSLKHFFVSARVSATRLTNAMNGTCSHNSRSATHQLVVPRAHQIILLGYASVPPHVSQRLSVVGSLRAATAYFGAVGPKSLCSHACLSIIHYPKISGHVPSAIADGHLSSDLSMLLITAKFLGKLPLVSFSKLPVSAGAMCCRCSDRVQCIPLHTFGSITCMLPPLPGLPQLRLLQH